MRKDRCATCATPCAVPKATARRPDWKLGLAMGAAMSMVLAVAVTGLTALMNQAMAADAPGAERQRELTRFVRQECGFCHGLYLTGGLGTPLTAAALADKPAAALEATILHGRTGTAMPGWTPHLSESDTQWIVTQLLKGFPE